MTKLARATPVLLVCLFLLAGGLPLCAQDSTGKTQPDTGAVEPFPPPGQQSGSVEGFQDPFASDSGKKSKKKIRLSDPLEPWNRAVMDANRLGYEYVGEPTARAYRDYTPSYLRERMDNFFHNIAEPTYTVNAVLQGEWHDASITSRRFLINTIFGIGGFFDPAGEHLEPVERDFDQTLGDWHVPPGIYLVWPLIGPSSPRGTVGTVVDGTMDPVSYAGSVEEATAISLYRVIHRTSYRLGQFEALEKFSVDQYSAIKDYYEKQLYKKSQR